MRYVIRGRLRESCTLSPAEYFTLAVREWEAVLGWMLSGKALEYGRLGARGVGTILLNAESLVEARMLARSLPFAPYADVSVTRVGEGLPAP